MIEIMRTNDIDLISAVEAARDEIEIALFVADSHISALEGSPGCLPRSALVLECDGAKARRRLNRRRLGDHLLREGDSTV
jgi:hypothetical protein